MTTRLLAALKAIFTLRWNPDWDLLVVGLSWLLVTGTLYTATVVVGPDMGGGIPYFLLYGVLTAGVFGVGLPLLWMVGIRKRPLSELGLTTRLLGVSLMLQIIFALLLFYGGFQVELLPEINELLPLLALALTIGFFEAFFWRGWMLLRLEASLGLIPALILGSALYALYHIGYGMSWGEIGFLFFIGLMYGAVFRLTKNIFILWPIFQPMGQLITLINEGLRLPPLAALGFMEVLIVIFVVIWLAWRYHKQQAEKEGETEIQKPGSPVSAAGG